MPRSMRWMFVTAVLFSLMLASARPAQAQPLTLNQTGRWSPHSMWNGVAVHLALLPGYQSSHHSEVLWWYGLGNHDSLYCGLWGWNTGEYDCQSYPSGNFTNLNLPPPSGLGTQIFCGGMSHLGSGELLLPGGTQPGTENGMRHSWVFDPLAPIGASTSWTMRDSMADFRWYPTSTTLADGQRTLVTSGSRYVSKLHFFGGRIDEVAAPTDNAIFRYGLWGNGVEPDTVRPAGAEPWPAARTGHSGRFSSSISAVEMFGGKDAEDDPLNDVWLLRVVSQNERGADIKYGWQQLSPLGDPPAPRYAHGATPVDTTTAVVVNDTLRKSTSMFLVGGINASGQVLNDVWQLRYYEPRLGQSSWEWFLLAALPSSESPGARCGHSLVFDHKNRRLLLFGGRSSVTGGPVDNKVWAFQLSETGNAGTWDTLAVTGSRPTSRYDHATGFDGYSADSLFFVFGGETSPGKENDFWEFNLNTLKWTQHPTAGEPSARSGASMIVQHLWGRALVFGGTSASGSEDQVVYTMTYKAHPGHHHGWSAGTPMGFSLNGHIGWLGTQGPVNRVPEVFELKSDPGTTYDWQRFPSATRFQFLYPHGFLKSNGDVFYSGPGDTSLVFQVGAQVPDHQRWQVSAVTPGFRGGSSVMFRPGKVMKCGTPDVNVNQSAVGTTKWIDTAAASPAWSNSANDMLGRVNHNLVLLPNGQVFVTGGTGVVNNATATNPRKKPEIWDPEWPVGQGHWYGRDTLAEDSVIRDYHSTALLLPDGRILAAGGNVDGENGAPFPDEKFKANVFCPPYLFDSTGALAARPVITSAPQRIHYDMPFIISMPAGTFGRYPCLIRPAATTHGFDQNQRYVPLTVLDTLSYGGGQLLVQAPAHGGIAPPGDYLLFVLNPDSVPAVATWVRVGSMWNMGDVTAPGLPPTFGTEAAAGGAISVTLTAPGDDNQTGHAWQYDLRYSTASLNDGNVGSATVVRDYRIAPATAGTLQTFIIDSLTACTQYWVALRTIDESNNPSSWRYYGPQTSTCGGGGCYPNCEARATDTGGRREAASARAVSGTSSQRFAASPVLIAEYGSSGAGTTWTLTRGTRSEVEGLPADNTGGLAIQVDEPGLGWVTRSLLPSRAGDFGIQSLVRPGRVVLLEPGTIEEVAVSPNGLELLDARHSRAGALAFDSGDTTSLSPELLEGDTLVLAYRDVESHSGRFAITLRGESGVRATRSNPPAPEPRWEFALRQNRPNPFGVTTTIGFTIPRASFVRLEILDTQGRRVRVLANRTFEPGAHELVWDRRTTSGAVVSPGVYYYRIRAGEFSARKKLVVL